MNRKEKIILGASVAGLGASYLIIKSVTQKNIFNKILEAIGGSASNTSKSVGTKKLPLIDILVPAGPVLPYNPVLP